MRRSSWGEEDLKPCVCYQGASCGQGERWLWLFQMFGLTFDLCFQPHLWWPWEKGAALIRALPAGWFALTCRWAQRGGVWGRNIARTRYCFRLPVFLGQQHNGRLFVLDDLTLLIQTAALGHNLHPPHFSFSLLQGSQKKLSYLCMSGYGHSAPQYLSRSEGQTPRRPLSRQTRCVYKAQNEAGTPQNMKGTWKEPKSIYIYIKSFHNKDRFAYRLEVIAQQLIIINMLFNYLQIIQHKALAQR